MTQQSLSSIGTERIETFYFSPQSFVIMLSHSVDQKVKARLFNLEGLYKLAESKFISSEGVILFIIIGIVHLNLRLFLTT